MVVSWFSCGGFDYAQPPKRQAQPPELLRWLSVVETPLPEDFTLSETLTKLRKE